MDFVAEFVGLGVELPALLATYLTVILEGLGLVLLDLPQLSLEVSSLFGAELSLGDSFIDPFVQIGLSAVYVVLTAYRPMPSGRGRKLVVRGLSHAG